MDADINITIRTKGDNFDCIIHAEDADFDFALPMNKLELYRINNEISQKLETIVRQPMYSNNLVIDKASCYTDLHKIAELDILHKVFLDDSNEDAKAFFDYMQNKSSLQNLSIRIQTDNFFIPWNLFYDKKLKYGETTVDPKSFWGFKHNIEIIPSVNAVYKNNSKIGLNDLKCSFNLNKNIHLLSRNPISEQRTFFNGISSPTFSKIFRFTEEELMTDFVKPEIDEGLLYFYCHAKNSSSIESTDNDNFIMLTEISNKITLAKLKTYARELRFSKEPLVFLNACESAEMNSLFYAGFLPFFISRGAIGLIGTIAKIPGLFALEFAIKFFEYFFQKQKAGDVLYDLRNKFLDDCNNPLGLLYTLYGRYNIAFAN